MNIAEKVGVILVNLGTPNSTSEQDVRTYLAEFLSDKDVIRLPRFFWLPLLHLIILRTRPKKSAELYKKVWTEWGSPLLYYTFSQSGLLSQKLNATKSSNFHIDVAMRYGSPSMLSTISKFQKNNYKKILVIPMFPQYSTTTTRSIARELANIQKINAYKHMEILFIKDFHDNQLYIQSCKSKIEQFQEINGKPEKLVLSFHGIPESYIGHDEPYRDQCIHTSKLIAAALDIKEDKYEVAFQSRFGKSEWIKPYLASRLESLPSEGVRNIQVFCPGFVSDCLETIEEIGEESKELFIESGGDSFNHIPCLNDSELFIDMLKNLLENHQSLNTNYKTIL